MMAKHRIYISGACSSGCGMSTVYTHDGDHTLTVEWKGQEEKYFFEPPCAVYIETGNGFPCVKPLVPPRRRAGTVLWLCGVAKEKRCSAHDEYLKLCEAHRVENFAHERAYNRETPAWDRTEEQIYQLEMANTNQLYESEGPGWAIARSSRADCGGYYDVAAWVDSSISVDTAMEIVDRFGNGAPAWYIESLIRKPEEE